MSAEEQDAGLDDLFAALVDIDGQPTEGTKATSLRLPAAVHRAVLLAVSLGMSDSLTDATVDALVDTTRAFARQRAIAEHLARFPQDMPALADVCLRRVQGSDHPAASRPQLIADVATRYERRHPEWVVGPGVDASVDVVLEYVELAVDMGTDLTTATA